MKTKDVIYIIYNEDEQSATAMGIEFGDFVQSLQEGLHHLLLLKSDYAGENYHAGLRMEAVRNESLKELYQENVHRYGDFCWVDCEDLERLDHLVPQEKAELLYLGHYLQPLGSPFFPKLNNRFAYLAHDDGWYNKLYFREKKDYLSMLQELIPNRIKAAYKKKNVQPLSSEIGQQLLHMAGSGLLIDLYRTIKGKGRIEIPINVIGAIADFDDVYNNMERYKRKANAECWLVYADKEWTIKSYS